MAKMTEAQAAKVTQVEIEERAALMASWFTWAFGQAATSITKFKQETGYTEAQLRAAIRLVPNSFVITKKGRKTTVALGSVATELVTKYPEQKCPLA